VAGKDSLSYQEEAGNPATSLEDGWPIWPYALAGLWPIRPGSGPFLGRFQARKADLADFQVRNRP
jgi:hypothetical protein